MRRRMIAMLLVLVLTICPTGCAKDKKASEGTVNTGSGKGLKQTEEISGRYMEESVELPNLKNNEKIIKILQNNKKQFEVYTQNRASGKLARYLLQKDNTWLEDKPGWLSNGKIHNLRIVDICQGEDGNYYACVQSNISKTKSGIFKASADGVTSEMLNLPYLDEVVKQADGKDFYPNIKRMNVLKNGEIVISDGWCFQGFIVLAADGNKKDTIETDQTMNFLTIGDRILGMNKDGKIFTYNADTGKVDSTLDFDGNSSLKVYAVKEDDTILMGDSAGIHRLGPGGTLWETTVDGVLNSMSMPSLTMDSLYVTEGDSKEIYYIVYKDSAGGYQLKCYSFNKDVPAVPDKEITVYSLKENKTIRQAISLYQSKNLDVKINYVVAMGDEGGNITDYIRALNTELLSGKGADILVLDGLPVNSYLEKGVLADISDIINEQNKNGTLLTNIADYYNKEGKTYYIPIRFSVPLRIGNSETLKATEKLSGLTAYLNKSNQPYTAPTSYEALIRDNLAIYFSDICDNGVLEKGKLKEFLETMKKLAASSKSELDLYRHSNLTDENGNFYVESNKELFYPSYLYPYDMVTTQIKNVFDTMIPNALILYDKLSFDTLGQKFLPQGLVGLNKASKETELAKSFISFLLTSEIQDTNMKDGFPINTTSLKKWFDEERPSFGYDLGDDSKSIQAYWPIKEQRDVFLEAIYRVNRPIEINQTLFDMIIKSGVNYLSGETDIDETTSEIMSKVNTYLAE